MIAFNQFFLFKFFISHPPFRHHTMSDKEGIIKQATDNQEKLKALTVLLLLIVAIFKHMDFFFNGATAPSGQRLLIVEASR
jgi:hypothetical protein